MLLGFKEGCIPDEATGASEGCPYFYLLIPWCSLLLKQLHCTVCVPNENKCLKKSSGRPTTRGQTWKAVVTDRLIENVQLVS